MAKILDFHVPKTKREIVAYLMARNKSWNLSKMKKTQVLAIYVRYRQKNG